MSTHAINPQLQLAQSTANKLCFKPTLKHTTVTAAECQYHVCMYKIGATSFVFGVNFFNFLNTKVAF